MRSQVEIEEHVCSAAWVPLQNIVALCCTVYLFSVLKPVLGCEVTVRLTEVVRNVPDSTARELQRWRFFVIR